MSYAGYGYTRENHRRQARICPADERRSFVVGEFERRYRAHPGNQKAELVEGVVYVSSADYIAHARIHSYIDLWLGNYVAQTPGLEIAKSISVLLDLDNEVQPDVCAWRQESPSVTFDAHGMMVGAPDFVGEVAASSAANDLHKKKLYRRSQVAEYLVLAVYEQAVFWHNLQDGTYDALQHDANGIYRSRVFGVVAGCRGVVDRICSACWRQCRPVWLWWRRGLIGRNHAQIRPAKPCLAHHARCRYLCTGARSADRGCIIGCKRLSAWFLGRSSQTLNRFALDNGIHLDDSRLHSGRNRPCRCDWRQNRLIVLAALNLLHRHGIARATHI